jgi:formate hydrogenlyase subunit 6/NADH:ubiquinone oxidoreductase subunit I
MPPSSATIGSRFVLQRPHLADLFRILQEAGYGLVGPTRRDHAIVYDHIATPEDLPGGWGDVQEAGRYRLERRADGALFGYNASPYSWKKFLHEPHLRLWRAERQDRGFAVESTAPPAPRRALIGVRACELQAIAVQDRVLATGEHPDPHYAARRRSLFIVAVQCSRAGGTCFCASMGTGPRLPGGFDLGLVELVEADRHEFRVEVGSQAGADVLARLPVRPASPDHDAAAEHQAAATEAALGRRLETAGLREALQAASGDTRWEAIAARCLGCANCTMVCPTCFCTNVEDVTDLDGRGAERVRVWDSCFNLQFSYIHGGSIRQSLAARYRQWLTHKLASWVDQFGTSGCVGCGRCITWCPVGIDLTVEAQAFRERVVREPVLESRG